MNSIHICAFFLSLIHKYLCWSWFQKLGAQQWPKQKRPVSSWNCILDGHRVAFEEASGHRVLLNCGPGNQGRSTWGTSHGACLEFPREAGLILRGAGKAGNPFQTTQGNQLSCREQERSRSSEEVVPGLSVFPSREPGQGIFLTQDRTCSPALAGGFFTTEPPGKPKVT